MIFHYRLRRTQESVAYSPRLQTRAFAPSASYTATVNKAEWKGIRQGHMRGHAPNPCGQRELKRPAAMGLGALSPTAMRNESTVQVNVRGISFVADDKTAVVTPRPKKSRWDDAASSAVNYLRIISP